MCDLDVSKNRKAVGNTLSDFCNQNENETFHHNNENDKKNIVYVYLYVLIVRRGRGGWQWFLDEYGGFRAVTHKYS